MNLVIQKYGGTSVATIDRIKAVAEHVQLSVSGGTQVVVVVSAMGHHTDELLTMARQISVSPPRREVDMLLTVGERITMSLLSMALHDRGIPSISLTGSQSGILTDDVHGNARIQSVLGARIKTGLAQNNVVIVAGFQGMSAHSKEITTLGRGGSDLTAVALAHALKADCCQIYKDVDGVFTADPRIVANARIVRQLDWRTMSEMCWGGSSVVHARALHLAQKFKIRLEVRSSFHFDRAGTIIFGSEPVESMQITAIAEKPSMSVMHCDFAVGNNPQAMVAEAMRWLWQAGEAPLLASMIRLDDSADRAIFIVSTATSRGLDMHLRQYANDHQIKWHASHISDNLSCLTLAGDGFWQSPELVAQITETIGSQHIRALDVKNSGLVVCIPTAAAKDIQRQLHSKFIQ